MSVKNAYMYNALWRKTVPPSFHYNECDVITLMHSYQSGIIAVRDLLAKMLVSWTHLRELVGDKEAAACIQKVPVRL